MLHDIVGALWGPDAPPSAAETARTYVSRLRRLLPGATITFEAGGYRMAVDPATVDFLVFGEKLRAAGETDDRAESYRLLRGALGLWRGRALDGLEGAFFASRRTWLEQLRATAQEDRWAIEIELGDEAVVAELTAATALEPYRERLWELLIEALVRQGRCAEALAAYHRVARLLDENLGLRPGPGLRRRVNRLSTQHA